MGGCFLNRVEVLIPFHFVCLVLRRRGVERTPSLRGRGRCGGLACLRIRKFCDLVLLPVALAIICLGACSSPDDSNESRLEKYHNELVISLVDISASDPGLLFINQSGQYILLIDEGILYKNRLDSFASAVLVFHDSNLLADTNELADGSLGLGLNLYLLDSESLSSNSYFRVQVESSDGSGNASLTSFYVPAAVARPLPQF